MFNKKHIKKPRPRFQSGLGSPHPNRSRRGTVVGLVVTLSLLTVLTGIGVALQGCQTGITARSEILLPAIKDSWPNVETAILAGVEDAVASGEVAQQDAHVFYAQVQVIRTALDSQASRSQLVQALSLYSTLAHFADRGVESAVNSGLLSAGVGGSFKERLRVFGIAVTTYILRPTE